MGCTKNFRVAVPLSVAERLHLCWKTLNDLPLAWRVYGVKKEVSHLTLGEYVLELLLEEAQEFDTEAANALFQLNKGYIFRYRGKLQDYFSKRKGKPPTFDANRVLWGYRDFEAEVFFSMDARASLALSVHFNAVHKGEFEAVIQHVLVDKPLEMPK